MARCVKQSLFNKLKCVRLKRFGFVDDKDGYKRMSGFGRDGSTLSTGLNLFHSTCGHKKNCMPYHKCFKQQHTTLISHDSLVIISEVETVIL